MPTHYREDEGKIETWRESPEGFLTISGFPTRTGVFVYRNPDGSARRELRHPDDVFAADSLETLAGKPLTVQHHPQELLTPDNVEKYQVGSSTNEIHVVGDELIKVVYNVHKRDGIDAVKSKECQQLSCGYTCDLIPGKGVYNGEKYDARQTNIRYNHTTVLPRGRAGPQCAFRMDGVDSALAMAAASQGTSNQKQSSVSQKGRKVMVKLNLDGIEFDEIPESLAMAVNGIRKDRDDLKGRFDVLEAKVSDLVSSHDAAIEERDRAEARADALQDTMLEMQYDSTIKFDKKSEEEEMEEKDMEDMEDYEDEEMEEEKPPAKGKKKMSKDRLDASEYMAAEIERRVQSRNDALDLLAAYQVEEAVKLDAHLSPSEIRRMTIAAIRPDWKLDSRSDDYVESRFELLQEEALRLKPALMFTRKGQIH
jgi:uncharacterized protein